jgi:MYXO-CTERM domain-containing protein
MPSSRSHTLTLGSSLRTRLSGLVIALAIGPSAAEAALVTVGGISYDISTETTSYTGTPSLFQLPPTGRMPWWGDSSGTTASDFAREVFSQLGLGPTPGYGPLFAYDFSGGSLNAILQNLNDPLSQLDDTFLDSQTLTYAVATPQGSPSVPAPLPLMALAAAGAWSRRLRRLRSATEGAFCSAGVGARR